MCTHIKPVFFSTVNILFRAYCNGCILGLCNEHILENVESANPWTCFLCSEYDFATHGHLQGKLDWKTNVIKMFTQEGEQIVGLLMVLANDIFSQFTYIYFHISLIAGKKSFL